DGAADDVVGETTADDLDLGQLGHGGVSPRSGEVGQGRRGEAVAVTVPQGLPRLGGGLLLGILLGTAVTTAVLDAVDEDPGRERLGVLGALLLDGVLHR